MSHHPIDEIRSDPDVLELVYTDHDGNLLASKGRETEHLQSAFAYALQLFQRIGADLGADALREVQLQGKQSKALCLMLDEGSFTAVTAPRYNLAALARKFA